MKKHTTVARCFSKDWILSNCKHPLANDTKNDIILTVVPYLQQGYGFN